MGLEESIAQLVCNTYGSLQRGRTDNSFASSRSSCERSQHCDCGGKEGKGDRKVYWYDTVFIGPHFFTWPKRGKRIPFLSFRVLRSVTVQVHRVVFFGNFFFDTRPPLAGSPPNLCFNQYHLLEAICCNKSLIVVFYASDGLFILFSALVAIDTSPWYRSMHKNGILRSHDDTFARNSLSIYRCQKWSHSSVIQAKDIWVTLESD